MTRHEDLPPEFLADNRPVRPTNFVWRSGDNIMVWDPEDQQVERYKVLGSNGPVYARLVEIWRIEDGDD